MSEFYEMQKYLGEDLKLETLICEPVEVVNVKPGKQFFVPISLEGKTEILFEGYRPRVVEEEDGRGNMILSMPKRTVILVDFVSESRGHFGHKKKLFCSED